MIRILMIDDEDDARTRGEICKTVEAELRDKTELIYIDPNASLGSGKDDDLDRLLARVGEAMSPRLDLVLCDIKLSETILALPVFIGKRVRQENKACILLMYSGSIHKYLADLVKTKTTRKGREVEEPIRDLLQCDWAGFVSRDQVEDTAVSLLRARPLLLHLEQRLSASPDTRLKVGRLNGMTFGEVAKDVRAQTERGVTFGHEATDWAIDTMLDLNS